ncbi:hypothetical protein [Paenibacillus sp. NEAU-GSW1]|uniref:hypothetical protein n=1 Tax=Paenibacillus sp. NEAU-GSW1 TaxID=2682486 RepID=UPI0012E26830|nr:hypothetical protein [Paenibacillus sp. NEAU-GSW1]MUT66672.1 hypothetical protein [Paenibacillus sp. NEAU-GSW1]
MEDLIGFLLNNIYLVVIVGGVLLSLYRKANGNRAANPKMPNFGGGSNMPNQTNGHWDDEEERDHRPIAFPEPQQQHRPLQKHGHTQQNADRPGFGNEPARKKESAANRQAAQRRFPAQASATDAGKDAKTTAAGSPLFAETDELRKAIIYAEVLGPPRSKRPYRK